jgi:hypothetical protein
MVSFGESQPDPEEDRHFLFGLQQGCQMVSFQPKNSNSVKFWRALGGKMLIYFMAIWNILWPFGIFYGHLLHFVFLWYILSGFWYHEPRKIWQPCTL